MGKYEPIDTWEKSKGFSKEINVNDLIVEELEKKKTKIEDIEELDYDFEGFYHCQNEALKIIDKHISELKGETE